MAHPARIFVGHLRLPFQAVLAPFFGLGLLAAARDADPVLARTASRWDAATTLLVFALVHAGLYGGATVYNGYFDRDEGPVGMLRRPAPVTARMRDVALLLQLASVAIVAAVRPAAGALVFVMAVLGIVYSHPAVRLKRRPWGGLLTVAVGQGAMAVMVGYAASSVSAPHSTVWLVAAAASVVALGLYPVTQVYQIDEDRRRGDETFAVRYGWRKTLAAAGTASVVGTSLLVYALRDRVPIPWPAGAVALAAPLAAYLAVWARRFERLGPYGNHDRAMALAAGLAVVTATWIGTELWREISR